jgi:DNA ligase (NAD+)
MDQNSREYFQVPTTCPICKAPTVVEGQFLYCRSKSCPIQLTGSVKVWINRLGLLHWGDALIESLTDPDNPAIGSIADLYRLSVEEIACHCSGAKVAQKCYNILHANKEVTPELLLASMNIPNLAVSTATDIAQAGYDTIEKILALTVEDLVKIPNIGEITASYIYNGIQEREQAIKDLASVLTIKVPTQGVLIGVSICITGEVWKPRPAVHKDIMDAGGVVKTSVVKDLTFLVTNDTSSGTSKNAKAAKLGVTIINDETLREILGGSIDWKTLKNAHLVHNS